MNVGRMVLLATCSVLMAVPSMLAGQARQGAESQAPERAGWTVPRTAWGDPDLQGVWARVERVPLERPPEYAGREFLTDTEMAARQEQLRNQRIGGVGERGYAFNRRGRRAESSPADELASASEVRPPSADPDFSSNLGDHRSPGWPAAPMDAGTD